MRGAIFFREWTGRTGLGSLQLCSYAQMTTGIIDNLQALDAALRAQDQIESKEMLDAVLASLASTVNAIDRAIRA